MSFKGHGERREVSKSIKKGVKSEAYARGLVEKACPIAFYHTLYYSF